MDLTISAMARPDRSTVRTAVTILHDSFAPDEGGGVTAESFMAPSPGRMLIVAEQGERMVGFARIDRYGDIHGLLAWLAVADGARSMGVGRRLISASAANLADQGALTMFVECRVDDFYAPRRRFYERNGLRSVSGGDYWLRSHLDTEIQYDLLHRGTDPQPFSDEHRERHPSGGRFDDVDSIRAGATLIHESGTGVRRHRLDAGLDWTLSTR